MSDGQFDQSLTAYKAADAIDQIDHHSLGGEYEKYSSLDLFGRRCACRLGSHIWGCATTKLPDQDDHHRRSLFFWWQLGCHCPPDWAEAFGVAEASCRHR